MAPSDAEYKSKSNAELLCFEQALLSLRSIHSEDMKSTVRILRPLFVQNHIVSVHPSEWRDTEYKALYIRLNGINISYGLEL